VIWGTGGKGKVGEELEEVGVNHMVVLVGSEAVRGDGSAEQWRSRNSGDVVGVAPAIVVAGVMALRLGEVQEVDGNPF